MAITLYKEKAPVRGVLFDVDGVILDTERLYSRFWMEACHFYGFPMTKEQSLQMRSLNKTAGQEKFHELFGPKADYTTIRLKRIELMDAFIAKEGVAAKEGIFALLDALDQRVRRAYYSGTDSDTDFYWYLWVGARSPLFGEDLFDAISLETCVRQRISPGSVSGPSLDAQFAFLASAVEGL